MGFVIVGLIVVGAIVYFGGGNTVEGFGHDMSRTGSRIEQHTRD